MKRQAFTNRLFLFFLLALSLSWGCNSSDQDVTEPADVSITADIEDTVEAVQDAGAETVAIMLCQIGVAFVSMKSVQTVQTAYLVAMLYPACIVLVAGMEAVGFD